MDNKVLFKIEILWHLACYLYNRFQKSLTSDHNRKDKIIQHIKSNTREYAYYIPVSQLMEVQEGWRYACSDSDDFTKSQHSLQCHLALDINI